jgi:hypothetical protein
MLSWYRGSSNCNLGLITLISDHLPAAGKGSVVSGCALLLQQKTLSHRTDDVGDGWRLLKDGRWMLKRDGKQIIRKQIKSVEDRSSPVSSSYVSRESSLDRLIASSGENTSDVDLMDIIRRTRDSAGVETESHVRGLDLQTLLGN